MKTLKLFNAVVAKPTEKKNPFISEEGYIIVPEALWAKDRIISFYESEKLDGNELNKTFHKSWRKIKDTPRYELFLEQIAHYLSTYGTGFRGEVYIPDEVLNVPDVKIKFKVVNAYSKKEMQEKCLDLLRSGVALKEETINDLLTVLHDELDYTFTGSEGIKNREAVIKIADEYNVFPKDPVEMLRYCVYKSTGNSLLIKNKVTEEAIKEGNFNPRVAFKQIGLSRMAEIFNRFKPLFLSYKDKCPKTINRISKLSKSHHLPMKGALINLVTSQELTPENIKALNNATPFALFRAMNALRARFMGQTKFMYTIRNGKSWITENEKNVNRKLCFANYNAMKYYLSERFAHLKDMKVFLPENIEYALPTSEKSFAGHVPFGSSFTGDRLAVGIYWKNSGGANDLDLSGISLNGDKVGWNNKYSSAGLMYSGDITSSPNGAVEYLYADKSLARKILVTMNAYSGNVPGSKYDIIVGTGDDITYDYMMNPNNLILSAHCEVVQKQSVLGLLIPGDEQEFILLGYGGGEARVSGGSDRDMDMLQALFMKWTSVYNLSELLYEIGVEYVDDPEFATVDFSLDALEKDTFTKLFDK